ncbi:hypothetical protein Ahy_A06g028927 isoform A [Arachis hypogaea]|uniref:RIC1 C-terminal alpha solenoid region domain-containing protein n=1 Tax=Arachis hypogaea TaxID=3818 RepID=A0A445CS19_ARAHY|nr:hypothetical protein Ahy_A06g028927 isoform A [Arachis hypogaea]
MLLHHCRKDCRRPSLSGTTIVVWLSVLLPPSRIAAFSSSSSARQFLVFICSIALLPPSVGRSVTIVFVWSSQILLTHHRLLSCVRRLASVSVTILPPSSQTAQKKNPSPFQFPSFEFREQKLNQEKNLRLRRYLKLQKAILVKATWQCFTQQILMANMLFLRRWMSRISETFIATSSKGMLIPNLYFPSPHLNEIRDKIEEALRLADLSAEKPHFSHCLEWLLFTVFEADISRPNANKNQLSVPKHAKRSLLEKTCDLIRNFSEYLDVVVSVARKTDGCHWTDLL